MRFELQTITVTDNRDRPYAVDALVAFQDDGTPTGLAVHPVYRFGSGAPTPAPAQYTITHLLSGVRVYREPVASEAIACQWLERIAPLANWTCAAPLLRPQQTLRLAVIVAQVQAIWAFAEDRDADIPHPVLYHASSPQFTVERLTALIEWVTHAIEYVALSEAVIPALESLLALHAELARSSEAAAPEQAVVP